MGIAASIKSTRRGQRDRVEVVYVQNPPTLTWSDISCEVRTGFDLVAQDDSVRGSGAAQVRLGLAEVGGDLVVVLLISI